MANTRGVFTLQDVRYAQEDDVWVSPEQSFFAGSTSTPNVSYWAGGTTPSEVSSIDKLTFDNDTTALLPGSNLTAVRSTHGGFSSKNSGYFLGGRTPLVSSVDKLSYQSESVSKSPASNLNQVIQDARGTASETHGYSTGGYNGSSYVSTVNKLIFAVDTSFQSPSTSLITQRNVHGALGNQTYCYLTNGYDGSGYVNHCDRIVFGTDTTSRIPATFPGSRGGVTGASTDTIGYMSGGVEPGPTFYSTVNKFTFSTETTGTLPSTNSLPASLQYNGGSSTPSLGYFGGGKGSGSAITTMCKINSSDDTRSNVPGANLTATRYNFSAVTPRGFSRATTGYFGNIQNLKGAPSPGFGYWAGAPGTSNVHKHYFATDSVGESSTNLNNTTYAGAGMSNANNFYLAGGNTPSKSIIERITYATDTCVQLSATIAQNAGTVFAYGNKDKGYVGGGANGGTLYSSVGRFDYSSETYTRVPGGDLVLNPLSVSAGAGTPSFGVFGGGTISGGTRISYFQKLQYSTETNTRIPSANLPTGTGNLTGTGTGYAGYRGGGETPGTISNISRHVYATDAVSYLTNSLPAGATTNFESIGSGKAAYWGIISNNMSKMDYSTETGYTVPVPSTSVPYSGAASAEEFDMPQPRPETPTLSTSDISSSPNTGYFGGGVPHNSRIDKLNYSTEIMAIVPGANLSANLYGAAGTGSLTDGYFAGGDTGSSITAITKMTYASDSAAPLPSTNLSVARHTLGATGNSTHGYFGGGNNPSLSPGTQSRVDKLTYSDDTIAAVPGASLETRAFYIAAIGNPSAGYWGAGRNPSLTPIAISTMQKVLYSTDTSTTIPSGALSAARYSTASAGNSDAGYFLGGYSPSAPGVVSNVDKLSYSTETSSRVPAGFSPRYDAYGTGSSSAGYISGGNNPGSTSSRTEKFTFATETTVDLPGAQLSGAVWAPAAVSARANTVAATSNNL